MNHTIVASMENSMNTLDTSQPRSLRPRDLRPLRLRGCDVRLVISSMSRAEVSNGCGPEETLCNLRILWN